MNAALIAIGVPGSGKTTFLKPLAERHGLVYINKDDIREELTGDASDQSLNRTIWEEANRRTAAALARGSGVVLDATFAEARKRRSMIQFVRAHGASPIIGIYADVPLELAKERNRMRDRTVFEDVIHWMHELLREQPPSLADGFDALLTTDRIGELESWLTPGA